jgi:hypothetical protein
MLNQPFLNKTRKDKTILDIKDSDLINVHDRLMREYGWIPIEEFRNTPIPTIMNLMQRINERDKREYEESQKMKNKRR